MLEIKWKDEDQESKQKDRSRAKVTELKIGNKTVTSPFRGAKVMKSTSDFSVWNEVTGGILYPKTIVMMHMGVVPETIKNLTESNGKFNGKVNDFSSHLGKIDDKAIKMVYPRISKKRADEIPLKQETMRAFLQYLNTVNGNDANILPLPPIRRTLQRFNTVVKGAIEDIYPSSDKPEKPLIGYIPAFENALHAAKLAEDYVTLDRDVRMFVIDFANGRRDRTSLEVVNKLRGLHKKGDIEDFYVHAVNVPKDTNKTSAAPFYDLTIPIEGIDSFNDVVFPAGGGKPKKGESITDYNKKRRYSVASQYGSFSFAELKDRKLMADRCNGPVCKDKTLEELYKTGDYRLFSKMLTVHRIYLEMVELDEFGRMMQEKDSLLNYLREKPMVKSDIDTIVKSMRGS